MDDLCAPAKSRAVPLSAEQFSVLYPGLRRFAAVVGDADHDPDDIVQEALAAYLRRFAGTAGADKPAEYLRTMIVGLAKNHRRTAGRRRRREREVERSDLHDHDCYPSDTAALLEQVAPVDRALLVLVDLEGDPIGEAAQIVGIGTVAARARLSRARRALRRRLGEED